VTETKILLLCQSLEWRSWWKNDILGRVLGNSSSSSASLPANGAYLFHLIISRFPSPGLVSTWCGPMFGKVRLIGSGPCGSRSPPKGRFQVFDKLTICVRFIGSRNRLDAILHPYRGTKIYGKAARHQAIALNND
jgi:hypothetical protein